MKGSFGWDCPPGAANDPDAPYNQIEPDDPEEDEDEPQQDDDREPVKELDEWDVQDWQDAGIDW